ncbi:MAG: hypothetical protein WKF78_07580 [Candidatus Limnocylindrales bacterium]
MRLEDQPDRDVGRQLGRILLLMDGRARYLRQLDAARIAVETEYLAGHPALFPAELRRWDEARHETDQMVAIHARLGDLDGWLPPPETETTEEAEAVVASLSDNFTEPAKVHALEKLDEGRRAFSIATRWLRPKLAASIDGSV